MTYANPFWGDDWPMVRSSWSLDPDVAHLNHGSFGAVPSVVQQARTTLLTESETNPNRWYGRTLMPLLHEARRRVSVFLGTDIDGVVFVPNVTTGMALALAACPLERGREILITDHAYPAIVNIVTQACRRTGAVLRTVHLPLPTNEADDTDCAVGLSAGVLGAVSDRTRVVVLDQLTSPTALRLPAAALCAALRDRGVITLVDGAHAPVTLADGPDDVGADFWVGSFHKWPCAPRGSAVLVVRPEHRSAVQPLAPSSEAANPFPENLAWHGTADYTPFLCIPDALSFLHALGMERIREHNRSLARYGAAIVAEALDTAVAVPDAGFEAMALVPLPSGIATDRRSALALVEQIASRCRAETAVTAWAGRGWLRLSAHAYNRPTEYEALAARLPALLR